MAVESHTQTRRGGGLRRKDDIDPDERTRGRDDAADAIEQLQRDGHDVASMSSTDIAEEIGWSRSHVQAVLRYYFEPVSGRQAARTKPDANPAGLVVEVPPSVESREDYLLGWVMGRREAREE